MAAFRKMLNRIASLHRREHGAALFVILMVVMLYAALSYVIAKTTSGGSAPTREILEIETGVTQQQINAQVAEFQRLLLRGCSPSKIYTYSYTQAEIDEVGYPLILPSMPNPECAMFSAYGGSLSRGGASVALVKKYAEFNGFSEAQTHMALILLSNMLYAGNFPGVGTDKSDLFFASLLDIGESSYVQAMKTCNKVNKSLHLDFTFDVEGMTNYGQGAISLYNFLGNLDQTFPPLALNAAYHGRNSGCIIYAGGALYYQTVYEQ